MPSPCTDHWNSPCPATDAQIAASATTLEGVITIDRDGDVIPADRAEGADVAYVWVYGLVDHTNAVNEIANQVASQLASGELNENDLAALDSDDGLIREAVNGIECAVWIRDGRVVVFTQPDLVGPEFWAEVEMPRTEQ
jgi:hypothetical protein